MPEVPPRPPITLTSNDRLVELRTLAPIHAERIFELIDGNPKHLVDYDPNAEAKYTSPETIRDFIMQEEGSDMYSFGIWDVSKTVDGPTMVGVTELNYWAQEGYTATWVGPAFRRQGYATRAARTLINFAFNTLNLTRLIRTVHKDNIPSLRATQQLGFALNRTNDNGLMTFILRKAV